MSESMRTWVEIIFNISYLAVIWSLVVGMRRRQKYVSATDAPVARPALWAFALLALGDTGHVGFRVLAYALGGLESKPVLLGIPVSLVGIGSLATAVTLTFFYALMLLMWSKRFNKPLGWFGWVLIGAGLARLIVMALPQNGWDQVVAPYEWSLLRNALLVIQGLGVLYLILRDASQAKDNTFTWIGVMIAISYAFYAPVILWAAQAPLLGMLMIPKTLAYVGIAILVYRRMYAHPADKQVDVRLVKQV